MTREDILEKSRAENRNQDERDRHIAARAASFGTLWMSWAFVFFFIIEISRGETGYELVALQFSYLTANQFYRYKLRREKKELCFAAAWLAAAIVWTVLYFVKG